MVSNRLGSLFIWPGVLATCHPTGWQRWRIEHLRQFAEFACGGWRTGEFWRNNELQDRRTLRLRHLSSTRHPPLSIHLAGELKVIDRGPPIAPQTKAKVLQHAEASVGQCPVKCICRAAARTDGECKRIDGRSMNNRRIARSFDKPSSKPTSILQPMAKHIEFWGLDKLIPFAKNPRIHSDAQIAASIRAFGFNSPILVDSNAGIIAGRGRFLAARELQLKEVPVIVLDHLTETQKRAYIIADNQLALNAGWDNELLRLELAALQEEDFNVELIGFEDGRLAQLLADQEAAEGLTDEDAAPELPQSPVSASADLWVLGNHKLLVGDATVAADVQRLMGGDSADCVFSDPPYNTDYEGYTEDRLKIPNDQMSANQFKRFLRDSFRSFRSAVKPGASLYVCHSSFWQREFQNALEMAGFEVRCQIIWAKNTFAWGLQSLQVSTRAYFLLRREGPEGSLVRRQIAIDSLGAKQTYGESITSDDETGRTHRTRAGQQQ
jgi:hypothetical protein